MKKIYDAKNDLEYQDSYIDADEIRERVLLDGSKISYRYVHGGFREKGVKFLFCFPSKEKYAGRFFQYLSPFPGPDEELVSLDLTGEDDKIAFCLTHGAYFVESNMGSKQAFGGAKDGTSLWKASAAVAEYSRKVAMEYYNCERPYGYVHGGSGGGYKTMACIENTNAWDGAVPYVIGSPVSLPNTIAMHVQGQRCLRHAFKKIMDALEPGGSGDIYAGLTEEETLALKEVTQMGFPPEGWFTEAMGINESGALPVLLPGVKAKDPSYFKDFWEKPGYLGADKNSSAVRDRILHKTIVKSVHAPENVVLGDEGKNGVDDAWKKKLAYAKDAYIELETLPQGEDLYLEGVEMQMLSGEAKDTKMVMGKMIFDDEGTSGIVIIGFAYGVSNLEELMKKIQPGDEIVLDNSDYIAIQSYYRHQVPEDLSFHAWDQFRNERGKAILPQRESVIGYNYCGTGTVQEGTIQGKVIVVQGLMDNFTCAWCADWYRNKIIEATGSDKDVRVYYMDKCTHADISWVESTRATNYLAAVRQALLDLSDWVERGIEPRPATNYRMVDNQVVVGETAEERKGIQPVGKITVAGKDVIRIKAGEEVVFDVEAQMPEGSGEIVAMDTAFEDSVVFPDKDAFKTGLIPEEIEKGKRAKISHSYEKPGTYFATVRIKGQRTGNEKDYFTQIRNLSRMRVIVE